MLKLDFSIVFLVNSASEKQSLLDASPSEAKTKSDQIPEKDDCTKFKDAGDDVVDDASNGEGNNIRYRNVWCLHTAFVISFQILL